MTSDDVECGEDCPECPLCMETLDLDDINFYPCTCGYQVCKFCWHRMKTDENGLCPACRQKYPDDPVEFKPIATEAMQKFKGNKKQQNRAGQKKKESKGDRIIDSRKHLATIRVVQKNLVFVIGLPPKLTDPETLKRSEYFGKYGKILKVMVNTLNANGTPASSASAYITYLRWEDALRAIKALNNLHLEGRVLKASLGTTKYCVNFLKNHPCTKAECMYLHDLGDGAASFTKEEMQQGKHQEYEKQLLDSLNTTPSPSATAATTPTVAAPVDIAPRLIKMASAEDVAGSADSRERPGEPPLTLQQREKSSLASASSSSLSSSSGSLKSSENCQSERNSPSNSVNFDLFVDTFEEFGFDPFNESAKGLADLMELESRSRPPPLSSQSMFQAFGVGPLGAPGMRSASFSHVPTAFGMPPAYQTMQPTMPSYDRIMPSQQQQPGMSHQGHLGVNGMQGGYGYAGAGSTGYSMGIHSNAMYLQRRFNQADLEAERRHQGQKWPEPALRTPAMVNGSSPPVLNQNGMYHGPGSAVPSEYGSMTFQNSRLSVQ